MRDRIIGHHFFFFCWEDDLCKHIPGYVAAVYCVSTPDGTFYQQDGASAHFSNIFRTFLDEQLPTGWIGRWPRNITWPARSPDLTPPDIFLWVLLRTWSKLQQYVIWQTHKKEFMLLSTMSHHRSFITHGSRLNTGWTFPMPLMLLLFVI